MICFKAHLFSPLLHLEKSDLPVKLSPLPIKAESEQKFVHDLMKAEESGKLAEWLGGKSLYLMRNADKKDFILISCFGWWIINRASNG